MNKIEILKNRLNKINIKIELVSNYPWIYLYKVNDILVKELYKANHGFTVAFVPLDKDKALEVLNITETIKIIRKYNLITKQKQNNYEKNLKK